MSESIRRMFEQSRKNMDRMRLQSEGFFKVSQAGTDLLTGKKSYVDYKGTQLEVKYDTDFALGDKSAREIVRELRVEKKSADYNGDSDTSRACRIVIDKYLPEAEEEATAGE